MTTEHPHSTITNDRRERAMRGLAILVGWGGGSGDTASQTPYAAISTAASRNGACHPKPSHAATMIRTGPARSPIDAEEVRRAEHARQVVAAESTRASSEASTIADAATPITNDAPTSTG